MTGVRLLGDVWGRRRNREGGHARLERLEVDADRVLPALAKIAFCDIRRLFDATGDFFRCQGWMNRPLPPSLRFIAEDVAHGEPVPGVVILEETAPKYLDQAEALGFDLKTCVDVGSSTRPT